MTRPFRFIAGMPRVDGPADRWLDRVKRIEDLGFDAVSVSEHLTGGWQLEATTAMASILSATSRLRVLSLVLANDFRNPVLLHKTAATLDFLGGGRLDLGLGAGWLARDYAAAGVAFAPPGVRIGRLQEAVAIIKGLFASPTFSFAGRYYTVDRAEGLPRPTQLPHPPILIGGGGPGILELAAREADIVAIHARMDPSGVGAAAARDLGERPIAAKVEHVRDGLRAAGRSLDEVELELTIYACQITDYPNAIGGDSAFSALLRADPELAARSPAVLVGSLAACVDRLHELRERFGFNVFKLPGRPEIGAPIVRELAGR